VTNAPAGILYGLGRDHRAPSDRPRAEDEAGLVERAKGDAGAFGRLYRRHYPRVAGYLYRRTGDVHLSEDLAAETFIAVWRGLGGYRRTGAPFEAWLLRIATNTLRRWMRRHRGRSAARPGGDGSDAWADAATGAPAEDGADVARIVRDAVRRLSMPHQDVIALVHYESLSIEQAALVLGVPPGTVKSRLARARAALREDLERLEMFS